MKAPSADSRPSPRRSVPEMDFVIESGNRLWGCKYGVVDGKAVNEIYASKLGDFKNWNCYAGRSTDSYVATRGSDGPFTGVHATITEINANSQRLRALVEILGRETPVDLEFKQVEKVV